MNVEREDRDEVKCACGHARRRHVGGNCNPCGWRGLRCKEFVMPCEALLPRSRRHGAQGYRDIPCGRRSRAQVNGKYLCGLHTRLGKWEVCK